MSLRTRHAGEAISYLFDIIGIAAHLRELAMTNDACDTVSHAGRSEKNETRFTRYFSRATHYEIRMVRFLWLTLT